MKKRVSLSASILAADMARLGQEVNDIVSTGIDTLHIDIMDRHFVPNISFGPYIVSTIRHCTPQAKLDVHLMVYNPKQYLVALADQGATLVSFHIEAVENPADVIKNIRSLNLKVGLAINPETKTEVVKDLLPLLDQVLIMGVNPGFGGQSFIPSTLEKISTIHNMLIKSNIDIAVDGGVSLANAKSIADSGANILVAGTALFREKCYTQAVNMLLKTANGV